MAKDNAKDRPRENQVTGRKSLNIALIGAGAIFIILLVGAVIVMGSLLSQFTDGRSTLGTGILSDYTPGVLVVRDTPVTEDDPVTGQQRIKVADMSRSAVLSSVTIHVYGPGDGYLPDVSCFGVIMDENGYIVTSSQVGIENGIIEVVLYDGRSFRGKLLGYDLKTDISVVKIEAENLRTAQFGNSAMSEGDRVLYIGLGQRATTSISEGMIGGTAGTYIETPAGYSYLRLTSTDRTGSDNCAGGVIVNSLGQIIGFRCSYAQDSYRMVYILSTSDAKAVVDSIIKYGYVKDRMTLGFKGSTVSEVLAKAKSYPRGVVIDGIESTSGLMDADVKTGDIIIGFAGAPIGSVDELEKAILQNINGQVTLEIYRVSDRKTFDIEVSLVPAVGRHDQP